LSVASSRSTINGKWLAVIPPSGEYVIKSPSGFFLLAQLVDSQKTQHDSLLRTFLPAAGWQSASFYLVIYGWLSQLSRMRFS
jgi:hypothetical protein